MPLGVQDRRTALSVCWQDWSPEATQAERMCCLHHGPLVLQHNQVMKHELYISFQVPSSVTLNILSNVWRPRSLGLPVARRSVMAQDDPVVSAQWMHEHLVMPDVKARQIVGSAVLVKARDRPEIEDDEFYSLDLYCQGYRQARRNSWSGFQFRRWRSSTGDNGLF
ncbi:uncharacterized protein [Zea mays]|nr:uncharacterized protein LOC103633571 isoform X3 [Zea mays]XP_020396988.1 uncharacterized protein LOC103633571 isoform X3 [Zea mays]|eukprot:XP_020396987.1 uncharacterized protein LOC103633571 isoform X3 [Zea mays]